MTIKFGIVFSMQIKTDMNIYGRITQILNIQSALTCSESTVETPGQFIGHAP